MGPSERPPKGPAPSLDIALVQALTSRRWLGYAFAFAAPALACLIQSSLTGVISTTPFALFYPAVMLVCWSGGLGPGFLSILSSIFFLEYFNLIPHQARSPFDSGPAVSLLVFAAMGTIINILIHRSGQLRTVAIVAEARERALKEQSEKQKRMYDALFAATDDHVFMLDRNKRLVYVNHSAHEATRTALKAWGQNPAQPLLGKTPRELGYADGFLAHFEANLDLVLRGQFARHEFLFPSPGGPRAYEYILSPVYGSTGEIEAVVGFTRDIHDDP